MTLERAAAAAILVAATLLLRSFFEDDEPFGLFMEKIRQLLLLPYAALVEGKMACQRGCVRVEAHGDASEEEKVPRRLQLGRVVSRQDGIIAVFDRVFKVCLRHYNDQLVGDEGQRDAKIEVVAEARDKKQRAGNCQSQHHLVRRIHIDMLGYGFNMLHQKVCLNATGDSVHQNEHDERIVVHLSPAQAQETHHDAYDGAITRIEQETDYCVAIVNTCQSREGCRSYENHRQYIPSFLNEAELLRLELFPQRPVFDAQGDRVYFTLLHLVPPIGKLFTTGLLILCLFTLRYSFRFLDILFKQHL